MNPCEINAVITAITNYLFVTLSKEDFVFLNVFLSELSKSMFATELFRGLCRLEESERRHKRQEEREA